MKLSYIIGIKQDDCLKLLDFQVLVNDKDHVTGISINPYDLTKSDDIDALYKIRNQKYEGVVSKGNLWYNYYNTHGTSPSWFTLNELIVSKSKMSYQYQFWLEDIETQLRWSNQFDDYTQHKDEIIILTEVIEDEEM